MEPAPLPIVHSYTPLELNDSGSNFSGRVAVCRMPFIISGDTEIDQLTSSLGLYSNKRFDISVYKPVAPSAARKLLELMRQRTG